MAKFNILVIDDEVNYPMAFKYLIESKGDYFVDIAANGSEGIQKLKKSRPDLLLLDIMMPGDDGIEVLKKIKGDVAIKDIPVVMLTAVETKSAKEEAAKLGVLGYLNKPIDYDDLLVYIYKIKPKA